MRLDHLLSKESLDLANIFLATTFAGDSLLTTCYSASSAAASGQVRDLGLTWTPATLKVGPPLFRCEGATPPPLVSQEAGGGAVRSLLRPGTTCARVVGALLENSIASTSIFVLQAIKSQR